MAQTPRPRLRTKKHVSEPLIGSFLLESITTGMYGESRNAIREYVQNSYDGIQAALGHRLLRSGAGKIVLTLAPDRKSLIIHDNGAGLGHRIAVNTLTAVGASRKERGRQAGFRGIGRLAGIAFSDTLRFRTKAVGDEVETIVEFDCAALRRGMLESGRRPAGELISACTTYDQVPSDDADDHFFEVSLLGLRNAPAEATDPIQMKVFLSQVAPVDFHPDFREFKKQIFEEAEELEVPELEEALADVDRDDEDDEDGAPEDDGPDWSVLEDEASDMLERIPVEHVAVSIRSGSAGREEKVYKPYRPALGVGDSDDVPLSEITVHGSPSGAWWGWIGHKIKPGGYQDDAVAGVRFRLKNIQIDGNELITLVPSTNKVRDPFSRLSDWFIGEIYLDPRAVVPNARRDNFEEEARWLAIRDEISRICSSLTAEAHRVSKEHQGSLEVIEEKTDRLRKTYLSVVRAKTFNMTKAQKVLSDSDKLQKDIEKAGSGAPGVEQLRLKSLTKELTQIRVGLLERPKTPEYGQFREALLREFLEKTLAVLNDYLEIDDYDEVKEALKKALR